MSAYIVGEINVTDPSWMAEYRPKTARLVEKYGGRYLAAGGVMDKLEGDAPLPSALVILEFPDMHAARAWYNDPEYKKMITLRQSGSSGELMAVEGGG